MCVLRSGSVVFVNTTEASDHTYYEHSLLSVYLVQWQLVHFQVLQPPRSLRPSLRCLIKARPFRLVTMRRSTMVHISESPTRSACVLLLLIDNPHTTSQQQTSEIMSADLATPFLDVPSGNNVSSGDPIRSDEQPFHETSWFWDQLLPIAFFPLITFQFLILLHYNFSLCPLPVLFSVGVFIFTTTMYRQILSESQLEDWLVLALFPELSIFVTVTVATVTFNAILAYQTLLVSTIIVAVIAAGMTLRQIWEVYNNESQQDDEESNSSSEATKYALVYDC